jgi:hypothetical protein
MKHIILLSIVLTSRLFGQGTLIYDQQSATNGVATFGSSIRPNDQSGQSFTPGLSAVGFVQFQLADFSPGPGVAAIIAVNLWADSLGGTFLGSTDPIPLPAGFFGNPTFFFSAPVPVLPGTQYYFEPVIQAGGGNNSWFMMGDLYNYPGGAFIFQGQATATDRWFREGIVVPEPSCFSLLLMGIGSLWLLRRTKTSIA